jgi:hypothetical protein
MKPMKLEDECELQYECDLKLPQYGIDGSSFYSKHPKCIEQFFPVGFDESMFSVFGTEHNLPKNLRIGTHGIGFSGECH